VRPKRIDHFPYKRTAVASPNLRYSITAGYQGFLRELTSEVLIRPCAKRKGSGGIPDCAALRYRSIPPSIEVGPMDKDGIHCFSPSRYERGKEFLAMLRIFFLRTVAWRSRPTTGPFCFFSTKKFNEILKSRYRLGRTSQYSNFRCLHGNSIRFPPPGMPNPKPIRNTQSSRMNREVEDRDEDTGEMTFELLSPVERSTPVGKLKPMTSECRYADSRYGCRQTSDPQNGFRSLAPPMRDSSCLLVCGNSQWISLHVNVGEIHGRAGVCGTINLWQLGLGALKSSGLPCLNLWLIGSSSSPCNNPLERPFRRI